jgi:hypothetical protein
VAAAQIASDAVTTAKILQSNVTQNKLATNAVGTAQILQSNVTQTKLATNAVGTAQILQSNVTQTKLASNSVGPAQLQSTAVTAGTYTTANITVDEDGRLTSASSGAGGDGGYIPLYQKTGGVGSDTSGNFVITIGSCLLAFAGQGGSGKPGCMGQSMAAPPSQPGCVGLFKGSYTAPATLAYVAGKGGDAGNNTGQAGGNTTLGNIIGMTIGNPGRGGNPGECAPGTAGTIAAGPGGTLVVDYAALSATTNPAGNVGCEIENFIGVEAPATPFTLGGPGGNPQDTNPNSCGGPGFIRVSILT